MTAPVSDVVSINITEDSVGVTRQGFGTPLVASFTAGWAERTRTYSSVSAVATDFATTSIEYKASQRIFGQSPKPKQIKIGRFALGATIIATLSTAAVRNSHAYKINVEGDGVTSTAISSTSGASATTPAIHSALVTALNATVGKNFTASFASLVVADFTFTAGADDVCTAAAHGLLTGDGPIRLTTSAADLPLNLLTATDYWIIKLTDNTFKLATSLADALAGTAVDIGDAGTGTHTISDTADTKSPSAAFTVTGDAAGEWFSLEVNRDDLNLALTHSDPGIATDLEAVKLEDNDWYVLYTPAPFNSNGLVLAASEWIESEAKMYFADVVNTVTLTGAAGGAGADIADNLHTLAYARTAAFYHSSAAALLAAGFGGRYLPTDPGSAVGKFKRLAGIAPVSLTDTHRTRLRAKCCNWFEKMGGLNVIFDGRVAKGGGYGWIDVTRDLDYVKDDLTARIYGALAGADKVDHDDPGYTVVESALRAGLENAVERRIFRPGYTVEIPLRVDISDDDVANRVLPDVKFAASLRGAVQGLEPVNGSVSL
jgi:hypothetical protein